jgi:Rrf2 family nitric oxide-sensitive transcriptional repressor
MQLNITTDYALRILVWLAANCRQIDGIELSETLQIPYSYLVIIMGKLKNAGWVSASRGQTGGYSLAAEPSSITLWDVIVLMERNSSISRCLAPDYECDCIPDVQCPIRKVFHQVQQRIESMFRKVTIQELVDQM